MAQSEYVQFLKLVIRVDELEKRIAALESKPKLGRPPKDQTQAA